MGESSASIRNKAGDNIYFFCTSGQAKQKAGVYINLKDSKKIGSYSIVQFVVDGKNYALGTKSGAYDASGRAFFGDLYSVVTAISESDAPSFTIEIPEKGVEKTFSLLNARDHLGKPPKSLIDPCV